MLPMNRVFFSLTHRTCHWNTCCRHGTTSSERLSFIFVRRCHSVTLGVGIQTLKECLCLRNMREKNKKNFIFQVLLVLQSIASDEETHSPHEYKKRKLRPIGRIALGEKNMTSIYARHGLSRASER